jgi:hypothetical protein
MNMKIKNLYCHCEVSKSVCRLWPTAQEKIIMPEQLADGKKKKNLSYIGLSVVKHRV